MSLTKNVYTFARKGGVTELRVAKYQAFFSAEIFVLPLTFRRREALNFSGKLKIFERQPRRRILSKCEGEMGKVLQKSERRPLQLHFHKKFIPTRSTFFEEYVKYSLFLEHRERHKGFHLSRNSRKSLAGIFTYRERVSVLIDPVEARAVSLSNIGREIGTSTASNKTA